MKITDNVAVYKRENVFQNTRLQGVFTFIVKRN